MAGTGNGARKYMTMKKRRRKAGFTLIEMLVVISIIAIMISLTVPAINNMVQSQRLTSAKNLIRTALAQAQAYAVKERKYAGLRFQEDRAGRQYIILVESKNITIIDGLNYGAWNNFQMQNLYTPVDNVLPMALPVGIAVLPTYRSLWEIDFLPDNGDGIVGPGDGDGIIDPDELAEATTFCILFNPSGQLVMSSAQCGPRISSTKYPGYAISYNDYSNEEDSIFDNNASRLPSEGPPLLGDTLQLGYTNVKTSQGGIYVYEKNTLEEVPGEERLDYIFL